MTVFSGMKHLTATAALVAVLPLGACAVSVDEDGNHKRADVQIVTPVGNLSVRAGGDIPDTGLAIYPGATPLREHRKAEVAAVTLGSSFGGVKVAAANFATDASPDAVLGYYRNAMQAHGTVTECRGDIDFKGRRGTVCRSNAFSKTTQLAVGTENMHRLVSVKKRGSGSEFSLVYVQTRGT